MKEIVSNEIVQMNPLNSFLRAALVNINTYILHAKRHANCKNLELLQHHSLIFTQDAEETPIILHAISTLQTCNLVLLRRD
jgi:bacterioferritin (cytochrome b1)